MEKLGARIYILVALAFTGTQTRAAEVYSVYAKGCTRVAGVVVDVNGDRATLLNFHGQLEHVPVSSVELIAKYDIQENPFPRVVTSSNGVSPFEVSTSIAEGTFRGFAINFIENLVLFLDEQGRIRVIELDELNSLEQAVGAARSSREISAHPVHLVNPPGRESCPALTAKGNVASRAVSEERTTSLILADKLRIDSFWDGLETGYRSLRSLQERTRFYAAPLLFDQKTRLGFFGQSDARPKALGLAPEPWESVPIYLDFGSGSAYRFQSSTSIGTKPLRMLPQLRPMGALRAEFKSHLLHGIFAANLSGITAGKAVLLQSWDSREVKRAAPWLQSSFNHLTLLGVDYGSWSISYGYYFPDFAVGMRREFREISATTASPVWRVGYVRPAWRLEGVVFRTRRAADIVTDGEDLAKLDSAEQTENARSGVRFYSERFIPRSMQLTSMSLRVDFTLSLTKRLNLMADIVVGRTSYEEKALRRDEEVDGSRSVVVGSPTSQPRTQPTGTMVTNSLTQDSVGGRVAARMDIGQWVALGAEATIETLQHEAQFHNDLGEPTQTKSEQILSYLAGMELIL